ncbi:MAG: hypothetical protein D6691_10645 [Candidatus Hydrogenedentota bacterium]|uniref:Uncharacterized protein n=1 Tax=Sumerlaea chitinivorans TaxID=2250252 RepID=A0A2Z4Y6W9_SUMC1|nr:hypothetical protein BRCON_1801 [Candidatus Sumerlaea chitinivorans]RMH24947.1 MAG: hypothetical protein D6691_10645 [Candidatus Hydrogenedentota bacterium]GIX45508.1 MAG: hypothetical protein KatS3mg130_1916 [Candidatus Sumerlaea sp.]
MRLQKTFVDECFVSGLNLNQVQCLIFLLKFIGLFGLLRARFQDIVAIVAESAFGTVYALGRGCRS